MFLCQRGQCLEIYLLSERLLRRLYQKIFAVGTCRHRAWLYFAYALGQFQVHSRCGCDRRYKVAYKRYKRVKNSALFAPLVAFCLFLQRVLYSHLSAQARFPRLPTALSKRCLQVRRLIFQQYGKAFNRKTQYCRIFPTGNRKSCAYRLCFNAIVRQCCH